MRRLRWALCLLAIAGGDPAAPAQARGIDPPQGGPQLAVPGAAGGSRALSKPAQPPDTLDGAQVYLQFRDGLAEQDCQPQPADAKWQGEVSHAPARLADRQDDILPLFGYVVGVLRDAGLPTEFALIPFVESGYHPGAGGRSGPTGLWQFVSLTARHHGVRMRRSYDGRLSPVDSTQAAVRYLKTLHGMFGGNWRLAVMAYNAGENRVLEAMQRAGVDAGSAHPSRLPGLSSTTVGYVEKLHALACSLEQAGERPAWLGALQRPIPHLQPLKLPSDFGSLSSWARNEGHDAEQLAGLNPALSQLHGPQGGGSLWVLAPAPEGASPPVSALDLVGANGHDADVHAPAFGASEDSGDATHTVARGDTLSSIAHRYGLRTEQLLRWNRLNTRSLIKPGTVLRLADPAR